MIFNASITASINELIQCRVFDPEKKMWLNVGGWGSDADATLITLTPVGTNRQAGNIEYPYPNCIIEYLSNGEYIGEDTTPSDIPEKIFESVGDIKVRTDKIPDRPMVYGDTIDVSLPSDQIGAIIEARDASNLARKLQSNKAVISEDGSFVTIYDDDQVTILYKFAVSADQKVRIPV